MSRALGGSGDPSAGHRLRRAARHEGGGPPPVGRRPRSRAPRRRHRRRQGRARPRRPPGRGAGPGDGRRRRPGRGRRGSSATSASTSVAVEKVHAVECDIYSPCALGAVARRRPPSPSCGARRWSDRPTTSWPTPACADRMADAGVLYAPDFVVNAGGVINIAEELVGATTGSGPTPRSGGSSTRATRCSRSPRPRASPPPRRPTAWPSERIAERSADVASA